jgi:hypothetical protein
LPASSPHFVASSSASLVSSDLNWCYIARQPQIRKVRHLVTGYALRDDKDPRKVVKEAN